MRKIMVQSVSPLENAPEGAVIGIVGSEDVFEVFKRENRGGEFVDFVDKDGKVCRLYVRAFGKLPHGIIERRKW